MPSQRPLSHLILVLCVAAGLIGCGGSGAPSNQGGSNAALSSGGSGGSGDTNGAADGTQLFAMDDMNAGFDHVWVTIDSVSLTPSSGSPTKIFDATTQGGRVVDLRSLRDATGAKFLLLDGFNTPRGTFTGVTVKVASQLTIVQAGATTGTAATFTGSTGGTFSMNLNFPSPQTISSANKVVVDFDLANWTLTGSSVAASNNAFLALGSNVGLDDGRRHVPSEYDGKVSSLGGTSPAQTFVLVDGRSSLNVVTSSATTVVNSDGSSNPILANGQQLEVTGTFDVANDVLDATSVTIRVGTGRIPPAQARGVVTAFDASAGTVTIQTADCDGFQPSATTLTVSVGSGTIYFDGAGVTDTETEFFASLVANKSLIAADGTESGSTLTAVHVAIVGPPTTVDAAIRGSVTNANPSTGTFDLTVSQWEGRQLAKNSTVHVVSTTATVFRVGDTAGTQAGFFTGITADKDAAVRGSYDPETQTLTAVAVSTGSDDRFRF